MEYIKKQDTAAELVITFFSPSGYEIKKNEPLATFTGYLPLDNAANARDFLDIIQPDVVFFVKYEFWYHYIDALSKKQIPLYLLSGIFRSSQPFFKWYGQLHRKMLKGFTYFFLQDKPSVALLQKIGIHNVAVTGDTRFDRVSPIPFSTKIPDDLRSMCTHSKTIVAGSCWEPEENLLLSLFKDAELNSYKYILVPHDINRSAVIQKKFSGSRLYSEGISTETRVVIIDSVGLLSGLYGLGWIQLVGGGFSGALHNILEAAVWSRPVCFGPHTEKFPEAATLVGSGGGQHIQNSLALKKWIQHFEQHENDYLKACEAAGNFIQSNQGATMAVMHKLAQLS